VVFEIKRFLFYFFILYFKDFVSFWFYFNMNIISKKIKRQVCVVSVETILV